MKHVSLQEYESAKNEILFGMDYKEYSTMENGVIHKRYVTEENGTFYEVNNNGRIEFWSERYSKSRIYNELPVEIKDIEVLGVQARQIDENHYCVNLSNGEKIYIEKNVELYGNIWAWKVDTQHFDDWKWAVDYLERLISEKLTGIRIIYHRKQNVPEICGFEGRSCRCPGECNTMLCSHCPVSESFFAKQDGVKLVYAVI